jgi:DNA-binding response OmpR family regulator
VRVDAAEQATRADVLVQTHGYDVVVLDRDHLGHLGYSRIARWRRGGLTAHILVLLPRGGDSDDKIDALDSGADAYLLQPFCIAELRARFRALGRRQEPAAAVLRSHDLEIDTHTRTARRGGRDIPLTRREFELLRLLADHQGSVVSRATIRKQLYEGQLDRSNVVDVYIRYLRDKIDKGFDTPLILTRRGEGYLLRAQGA